MKLHELFEGIKKDDQFKKDLALFINNLNAMIKAKKLLFRGLDNMGINMKSTSVENGDDLIWKIIKGRVDSIKSGNRGPRESLTGLNLILNVTTNFPSWSKIPKRKFSTSCTSSGYDASFFGDVFVIVPADNVKKFAMSTGDFNELRINSSPIISLTPALSNITKTYIEINNLNIKELVSYDQFKAFYKWADANLLTPPTKPSIGKINKSHYSLTTGADAISFLKNMKCSSFEEFFEDRLSPSKLGILEFDSIDELLNNPKSSKSNEVWFEGDYLLITSDFFDNYSGMNQSGLTTQFSKMIKRVIG